MAKYRITDPQTGKTVTVSGNKPPTQQQAEEIFSTAGLRQQASEDNRTGSQKGSDFARLFGLGIVPNTLANVWDISSAVKGKVTGEDPGLKAAIKPGVQGYDNPFRTEEQLERQQGRGMAGVLEQTARDAAGIGSWLIPVGKGLSLGKLALQGSKIGAGQAFSQDDAGVKEVVQGAALGAGTLGALRGVGKIFGKTKGAVAPTNLGKGLTKASETVRHSIREIRLPYQIGNAQREEAINRTMDHAIFKGGFSGSANKQYKFFKPAMKIVDDKMMAEAKALEKAGRTITYKDLKHAVYKNLQEDMRLKYVEGNKQANILIDDYLRTFMKHTSRGVKGEPRLLTPTQLVKLKKEMNKSHQKIWDKLNGNSDAELSATERVALSAWKGVDDAVKGLGGNIKQYFTMKSHLMDGVKSVGRATQNSPTFRFMGTSIPAPAEQAIKSTVGVTLDRTGRVLTKGGGKISNKQAGEILSKMGIPPIPNYVRLLQEGGLRAVLALFNSTQGNQNNETYNMNQQQSYNNVNNQGVPPQSNYSTTRGKPKKQNFYNNPTYNAMRRQQGKTKEFNQAVV